MAHDFKTYPELTKKQMQIYYFDSPHKQIFEDFTAEVVGVHDGDTIRVKWRERDFTFPIRMVGIAAPELDETGGDEAQSWLENRILGKEVDVIINPDNRVEKWGRLLGTIQHGGQNVAEEEIMRGLAKTWEARKEGTIPNAFKL